MAVHTVIFSKAVAVTSTEQAGWAFSKAGTNPQTIPPTSGVITGDKVVFEVPWTVDVIAGDVVTATYDSGAGTYYELGGDPTDDAMKDASLTLTNCLDTDTPAGSILDPFDSAPLVDPTGGAYIVDPNPA